MPPSEYKPLTVGDWIVTQLLLMIPFVGIILMFVWAFSSDTHPSKKTYCQATLIIAGCFLALGVLVLIAFGGFAAIMSHQTQSQ